MWVFTVLLRQQPRPLPQHSKIRIPVRPCYILYIYNQEKMFLIFSCDNVFKSRNRYFLQSATTTHDRGERDHDHQLRPPTASPKRVRQLRLINVTANCNPLKNTQHVWKCHNKSVIAFV